MSIEPLAAPILMLDTALYDGQEILTLKPFKANYHPIDWSQAKAKWPAVIMKEGEGLGVDPLFQDQFRAAEGHVWRGIYHYFAADVNAIKAAHTAADAIERAGGYGELGVFLDLESNPLAENLGDKGANKKRGLKITNLHGSEYLAAVASWLFEMDKRMKAFGSDAPLGIYTRVSFWDPLYADAGNPAWPAKYPVWVAIYPYSPKADAKPDAIAEAAAKYRAIVDGTEIPGKPAMPKGFKTLLAWQWTEKGRPADIEGYPPFKKSVDFNLLYYGPSSAKTEQKSAPEIILPDEAAVRLDELDRLQAVIDNYIKQRRQELS